MKKIYQLSCTHAIPEMEQWHSPHREILLDMKEARAALSRFQTFKKMFDNVDMSMTIRNVRSGEVVWPYNNLKQVIVVRKDLKMKPGKLAAQVAHGAMMFLSEHVRNAAHGPHSVNELLSDVEYEWLTFGFKKVAVQVDTEEEMMRVYEAAKARGTRAHVVVDDGCTVFHGVKTATCLALGPDYSSKLDPTTRSLRLL